MVFYRKYRPQKIDELDNEMVRQSLYSIFAKSTSPHAFLFTGPKGLGKTSTARIVAKVINCQKHKGIKNFKTEQEIEPDNKCEECTSITNGSNLDVFEIDGASNRGIDEIRDLKEKIRLAPFKAEKKVYIIDEVHMLTTEAFNALLKTLEEPPAHAVFILCTTEYQKVPETIASRCFRINFTRATDEELVRSMQRIIKGEGIKIDKEAIIEIAKLSDGSFRDGAKILEEVSTFAGRKKITKEEVFKKYNTLGMGESVTEIIIAFKNKDVKKGLSICRDLAKQGTDFKFFIQSIIERLHFMLLIKVGVEKGENSVALSKEEIQKLFELLSDAYNATKYSVLPQMPLEIAVLEWVGNGVIGLYDAEEDAQNNKQIKATGSPSLSESRPLSKNDNSHLGNKSTFSSSSNRQPANPLIRGNSNGSSPSVDSQTPTFFSQLINEVKVQNHLVAALLRSCSAEDLKNGTLNILASSKFHKEKLEDIKTLRILEDCASNMSDQKIKINIMLKAR